MLLWTYNYQKQYDKLYKMSFEGLAVALQSECQPETCTQMTATEQWIFLVSSIFVYIVKQI